MTRNADDDASMVASIYDEFGEYYHQSRREAAGRFANECIDVPAVLSLLPADLTGKHVLDAGCGSGIYATLIAHRGASVLGIDASKKMIEIAESEKPSGLNVEYQVGDLTDLPTADSAFDLITCTYVLENVADLGTSFREFRRVLRPHGTCVVSISHPLRAYAERAEQTDDEVWILRDYFDRSIRQSDFGNGMIVPKYRRPLEAYTEAIAQAGFVVARLLEPQPIQEGEHVDAAKYGKAMRLPQLLVMQLTIRGEQSLS